MAGGAGLDSLRKSADGADDPVCGLLADVLPLFQFTPEYSTVTDTGGIPACLLSLDQQ